MDPIGILREIIDLANYLHTTVQLLKTNKSQARRLEGRLKDIIAQLQGRPLPNDDNTIEALNSLRHCLNESNELLGRIQGRGSFRSMITARDTQASFNSANEQIDRAIQLLNLSLTILISAPVNSNREDELRDIHFSVYMFGALAAAINVYAHNNMFPNSISNYNSLIAHAENLGIDYREPEELQLGDLSQYMQRKVNEVSVRYPRSRSYLGLGGKLVRYLMVSFSGLPENIQEQVRNDLIECLSSDEFRFPPDVRNEILEVLARSSEARVQQTLTQVFDLILPLRIERRIDTSYQTKGGSAGSGSAFFTTPRESLSSDRILKRHP